MTEYTPPTEVVKDAACFPRRRLGEPRGIEPDAFDRWLAEHDAEVAHHARYETANFVDEAVSFRAGETVRRWAGPKRNESRER